MMTCVVLNAATATTRKVLFIGNSYTYTNTMPAILASLASVMGDSLVYDQSDPGGYTLAQHCVYAPTISKIFSQQWDLVVIQDQSEEPAFPPDQVDTGVYPYAHILDSMVHANDSCTQTMFMMTWGHANGDAPNCASYPVICTYDGMQERLRGSYLQMGIVNHADVAPVGMAFKILMDSAYVPWLYSADSSHPVVAGSYLEACALYASIFHRSPLGCSYVDGLAAADGATLQRVGAKVVFDSLSLWQQYGHYPYAGFSYSAAGSTISFMSQNPVASGNTWNFGDGATDTAASPMHSYVSAGTYVVAHIVSNNCFTETLTDTVHVTTTGISTIINATHLSVSQCNGVTIFDAATPGHLSLWDMQGRKLVDAEVLHSLPMQLLPGIYAYRWMPESEPAVVNGKIVVSY